MIDSIAMKGNIIIISFQLWKQILQQPYCYRKDEATDIQMGILVKHGHRYREYREAMCNIPKLPEHTAKRKNYTPRDADQAIENSWCRYIFNK